MLSSCAASLGAGNDALGGSGEDGAASQAPGGGVPSGPPMIVSDLKGVRQLVALLTVPLDTYETLNPKPQTPNPKP